MITISLMVGFALTIDGAVRRGVSHAAVAHAVRDVITQPNGIFAARSPGARRPGELLSTKGVRLATAEAPPVGAPEERVLAQVRQHPAEPVVDAAPFAPAAPLTGLGAPEGLPSPGYAEPGYPEGVFGQNPFAGAGGPGLLSEPGILGGPGGLGSPGGLGAGAPNGPVSGGPGGPAGVDGGPGGGQPGGLGVSAIPEPSTWVLMILASFAVGGRLRRMRKTRADAPAQSPPA